MLAPETKNRFLQLRAQGCTLSSIAAELQVSARTLVEWNRLHKVELRALRAIALEEVMSKCLPSREQTITALAAQLSRLDRRLATEDFSFTPAKQFFQMAAQLRAELRRVRLDLDAELEHAESAIPPSPTPSE